MRGQVHRVLAHLASLHLERDRLWPIVTLLAEAIGSPEVTAADWRAPTHE